MEVTSRRFDIKAGACSGLESWLESGPFCLLFAAVGKKYGRAAGTPSEKRNGLRSRSDKCAQRMLRARSA